MKSYFVYILASKRNGVLYVGFTNDLVRRMDEHKSKINDGFTKKYNTFKLVYFEKHLTSGEANKREQQIKKWKREWKINLIMKNNPYWKDLSAGFKKKLTPLEILEILFGELNIKSK